MFPRAWFVVVNGHGVDIPVSEGEGNLIGFYTHAYVLAANAKRAGELGIQFCREAWKHNQFAATNKIDGEPDWSLEETRRVSLWSYLSARIRYGGPASRGATFYPADPVD